jgi:hypothetical protein
VTTVPGVAAISIDQRALDPDVLASMDRQAADAARRILQRRTCRLSEIAVSH